MSGCAAFASMWFASFQGRAHTDSEAKFMSAFLYRAGRRCARRPLAVIGTWVALFFVVLSLSAGIGRDAEGVFRRAGP